MVAAFFFFFYGARENIYFLTHGFYYELCPVGLCLW